MKKLIFLLISISIVSLSQEVQIKSGYDFIRSINTFKKSDKGYKQTLDGGFVFNLDYIPFDNIGYKGIFDIGFGAEMKFGKKTYLPTIETLIDDMTGREKTPKQHSLQIPVYVLFKYNPIQLKSGVTPLYFYTRAGVSINKSVIKDMSFTPGPYLSLGVGTEFKYFVAEALVETTYIAKFNDNKQGFNTNFGIRLGFKFGNQEAKIKNLQSLQKEPKITRCFDNSCIVQGYKLKDDITITNEDEHPRIINMIDYINYRIPGGSLYIVGNTDNEEDENIGNNRANFMKNILEDNGLHNEIEIKEIRNNGANNFTDSNDDEIGRYNNRRVELFFVDATKCTDNNCDISGFRTNEDNISNPYQLDKLNDYIDKILNEDIQKVIVTGFDDNDNDLAIKRAENIKGYLDNKLKDKNIDVKVAKTNGKVVSDSQDRPVNNNKVQLTLIEKQDNCFVNNDCIIRGFKLNESKITDDNEINKLNEIIEHVKNNNIKDLVIVGHTDNIGTEKYNYSLGEKRANEVKDILTKNLNNINITIKSEGELSPFITNDSDFNRNLNRRVHILIGTEKLHCTLNGLCIIYGFKVDANEPTDKLETDKIAEIVNFLNNNIKYSKIKVVGHTDSTASRKYNFKLGNRRANNIIKQLKEAGLDERFEIIEITSAGEDKPIDTNSTIKGRYNNRRVELYFYDNDIK